MVRIFPNISESLSTIALTSNFQFGSHYDISSIASLLYDDAKLIVISLLGSEPGFFFSSFYIFCFVVSLGIFSRLSGG